MTVKKFTICFVIAFVLCLMYVRDFFSALMLIFGLGVFCLIIFIKYTFWKTVFGIRIVPKEKNIELNKNELHIFNDLITKPTIKEYLTKGDIDKIIESELKKLNDYKEGWQIHYAKDRIKEAITKHFKN